MSKYESSKKDDVLDRLSWLQGYIEALGRHDHQSESGNLCDHIQEIKGCIYEYLTDKQDIQE